MFVENEPRCAAAFVCANGRAHARAFGWVCTGRLPYTIYDADFATKTLGDGVPQHNMLEHDVAVTGTTYVAFLVVVVSVVLMSTVLDEGAGR